MSQLQFVENSITLNPRAFLVEELARRCDQNPRYSLRAFARILKITPSGLSMILSGKRRLRPSTGEKIAAQLGLEPSIKSAFLRGCGADVTEVSNQDERQLSLDAFNIIADWYHYGILSLIETKGFKPKYDWIASRFGISRAEAQAAVERLVRIGLLDISTPQWKQIGGPIKMDNTDSTVATRKFTTQILQLALKSVDEHTREEAVTSSMTLAMDPKLIPLARREIKKFKRYLTDLLESKGNRKEVYELIITTFPVSKQGK